MAEKKDGRFVSGEGYDVYVEGRLVGWFRNLKEASEAYNTEKEKASPPKEATMVSEEEKKGFLKKAWDKIKERAPSAEATKEALTTGAKAGGAIAGATGAAAFGAGAAAYGGAKAVGGGFWRLSKALFMAINIILLASVVLHYYDVGTDFGDTPTRMMVLFFFAVYAWLFIYSRHEQGLGDLKAMMPPLIISAVAIIVPIILLNQWVLKLTHMHELFANLLILLPIWSIVIMFGMPTTKFVRIIRIAYVIFVVVLFIPFFWHSISTDFNVETMKVGTMGYFYKIWDGFKDGLKLSYKAIVGLPAKAKKTAEKQIQYAVGDYYTGQVEQGKNQPIGVYLENVEPAAKEFYADDKVVVWATLIARTLDPDKEITVTASCWGQKITQTEVKKEKGDADPLTENDVFEMKTTREEEKYITCEFPPFFFKKGSASIFVNADFNFRTMSYVKAYFMNLETLRAMKREGIDPLDQYGMQDKKPQSVSTSGPAAVNIKTSDVPIGVSSINPMDIKIGITLENKWQGMIRNVTAVTIKVPESMEIVYCDHIFEKTACSGDECEDGQYTSVYRIKKEKKEGRLGLDSISNVKGYHTISCRARVNNINLLMGNYPLVTRYIKATADYIYSLEKSTAVTVKEALSNKTTTGTTTTAKPASFSYRPASSSVSLNTGQQKEFSVAISNPGKISYGWKIDGIVKETIPDATSYIFSSAQPGQATVTFVAVDENAKTVEEKSWSVIVS